MALFGLQVLQAGELLASSLDALDVGLEVWDVDDRLVLYNQKINQLHPGFHVPGNIGQTFETVVRSHLDRRFIIAAIGREADWLAQRLANRGVHPQPLLQELAGNRWVNIYESRTVEGYLVSARADVTDLVVKGKFLEASNQYLAQQSATDELTGLANRRRFDEALASEWLRAARSMGPLSLLMLDVDYFKRYNDRYGHLAGDECLRRVALALGHCVRRAGELVARYGGEEFVMLLPGADEAQACETAQMCLDRIQSELLPHADSPASPWVSFSIGVATLTPDAARPSSMLINAADVAMYQAKSDGRARFRLAGQAEWSLNQDVSGSRHVSAFQASQVRSPDAGAYF